MEKTAPGKHSSNPSPVLLAPACCSSTVMPCMLLAARRLWYLTPLPPPPLQMLSGARGSGPCDLSTAEKWWGWGRRGEGTAFKFTGHRVGSVIRACPGTGLRTCVCGRAPFSAPQDSTVTPGKMGGGLGVELGPCVGEGRPAEGCRVRWSFPPVSQGQQVAPAVFLPMGMTVTLAGPLLIQCQGAGCLLPAGMLAGCQEGIFRRGFYCTFSGSIGGSQGQTELSQSTWEDRKPCCIRLLGLWVRCAAMPCTTCRTALPLATFLSKAVDMKDVSRAWKHTRSSVAFNVG